MVWAEGGNDVLETDGDAGGDIDPIGWGGDFGGEFAVMLGDGFGGGDVFPFERLIVPVVFVVSRFVIWGSIVV